ncbi:MAG: VWA domain-containing protein [Actinobacteria bacterium]|nr:VWA domain-containing protein [Actinomycetota bacterium]
MASPLNLAIYAGSASYLSRGEAEGDKGTGCGDILDGIFYHVRGGLGINGGLGTIPSRTPAGKSARKEVPRPEPRRAGSGARGKGLPRGVNLEEARASLSLFGKGMCSRYLQAKPLEEAPAALANPWRPFPFSDGREIYLPAVLDLFADRRDNWRILRLYVSAQVGQWEAGTFDRPRSAEVISETRKRAAPGGSDPLGFIRRFLQLFPLPGLAGEIFLYLESARVISHLSRRYRGLAADISWFLPRMRTPLEPLDHRCALWNLYFDLLGTLAGTAGGGYPAGLLEAAERAVRPGAHLRDTLSCTHAAYPLLVPLYLRFRRGAPGLASPGEGFPGLEAPLRGPGGRRKGRPEEVQEVGALAIPEEVGEILGADYVPLRFPAGLGEFLRPEVLGRKLETGQTREAPRGPAGQGRGKPDPTAAAEEERSIRYPEWDYLARGYRRDWTTLFQILAEEKAAEAERLVRGWEDLVREVTRQFRMLRYRESTWRKKLVSGEEVDIQAAVERWVSLRCGLPPSEKVYMEKRRITREVSALFLLDLSASTSAEIKEGDHAGETVLDLLLASVAIMARALEQLGDRFGIYGFSGYGKDRVEFLRIKSFEETMNDAAWRRLAGLKPMKSTRMGAAVRHARRLLDAEASSLKLMLLLSDGYPQDFDYGEDRTDREYGLRDTAQALREAEAGHIVPFCVTVDAAGHDYLRRMCPPHGYLVVSSVEDLPRELPKVYLRLRGA